MSTDRWGEDVLSYSHGRRSLPEAQGAPFGSEHCDVYREGTCDGYGADDLCDNCRHINDFVDWWSQEAEAIREFHALLHGTAHRSSE